MQLTLTHISFFLSDEFDLRPYFYPLNVISFFILAVSNKPKWTPLYDATKGYLITYLIEVIRYWWYGIEVSHFAEFAVFVFPICGYLWRNYRDKSRKLIIISSIAATLKYAFYWILDRIFGL